MLAALDMCTNNCSHFLHCESRQGRYYCKCQAGFTGPHCDININECSSNPCINGKCLDDVNRYYCECNEGYWGTDCEKKVINEEGRGIKNSAKCRRFCTFMPLNNNDSDDDNENDDDGNDDDDDNNDDHDHDHDDENQC